MKHIDQLKRILLVGLLSAGCLSLQAGDLYVKSGGTGSGQSWADALGDIQQAISTAGASAVFVAEGDYPIATALSFTNQVALYGGFSGTESDPSQREYFDWDGNGLVEPWEFAHPTNLYGSGADRIIDAAVTGVSIDGFTISKGKAAKGGGVYLSNGAGISHCVIEYNTATGDGGGAYLDNAAMYACLVRNNVYAGNGGGVYANTNALIEGCKITGNSVLTNDLAMGDIIDGGIVFKIDYVSRKASVVSLEKSADISWINAGAWSSAYGSGYYFPSGIEMQQVYIVKNILNQALEKGTGTVFGNEPYWTASESGDAACLVFFDTGYAGYLGKSVNVSVRAVKSITF